jgi:HD-GYP domain-containing protein (c-di-GMP phosphodiesterase class II)
MTSNEHTKFIPVRKSQLKFYKKFSLYYQTSTNNYVLYKPDGELLTDSRIEQGRLPPLYVHQNDRIKVIKELQKAFNKDLKRKIVAGNISDVKKTLCSLVEETLSEPRSGTFEAVTETMDILISGYANNSDVLKKLAYISNKDYSTAIHSVNVMALTLGFCFHNDVPHENTKAYGLSALLHDVGKTEISSEILKAPRKLTFQEYKIMKSHTTIGKEIICNDKSIDYSISLGALEHHEKLDGSGYPEGKKQITFIGQLLGIVDCYEALTNEDRRYRRAKSPINTLKIIKEDVEQGKYNKEIFKQFCYSIV